MNVETMVLIYIFIRERERAREKGRKERETKREGEWFTVTLSLEKRAPAVVRAMDSVDAGEGEVAVGGGVAGARGWSSKVDLALA